MTTYYARHSSGQNFGVYLDVWRLETTADRVNVGVSGGHHSYAGGWWFSAYASLSYYENSGHDWENGTYSIDGYGDKQWFSATDFFWRREGVNRSINLYCYEEATVNGQYGTANANVWITVPALPPSATTLVLNSYTDNQATLSWTNPGGIKQAICIERRSNGGAWGEVQVIWGGATATSWTDTSLALNNTYEYRFRYFNEKAYGAYSNVVSVMTAPSAPTAISVVSAGGTNVNVTLTNDSSVATGIVWQWSATPDDESSWSGSTAVSGSPVTSFVASGVVGKAYIRVANTADDVTSGWIVSEQVITIAPPNPPVAKTPAGDVVSTDAESIMFSWDLNIIDKTDPTAYEFRYKVGEGSWVTTNKVLSSTANSHTLQMSTFSAGNVVTWQARMWAAATTGGSDTHGASEWSSPSSFTLHTPPQIEITSPNHVVDGVNTVSDMPILVTARITDVEGFSVDYAEMVLRDSAGIVYPQDGVPDMAGVQGGIAEFEIASSDFLPDNHSEYTVVVSATSGTTLSNTARAPFTTSFTEPVGGYLSVTNDPETGYVSLLATFDNSASEHTYSGETNEQYESTEGYVRSLTVEGQSMKWNQIATVDSVTSTSGGTLTEAAGTITNNAIAGHSYYLLYNIVNTMLNDVMIYQTGSRILYARSTVAGLANLTFEVTSGTKVYFYNSSSRTGWSSETMFCDHIRLIDMTALYGAGNEPASVDDPRIPQLRAYALAHPAYDAGSLISIEGVSVGDGTITTPLRSAGSVHDTLMADADSWTVGRKVGYVDLGTLNWTMQSAAVNTFYTQVLSDAVQTNNIVSGLYSNLGGQSVTQGNIFVSSTKRINICDGNYSDAATFKTAMSGVYAFYELATPTTDPDTSMSTIEIGSAFTVATDLDSTFELTTWDGSADAVSISVSRVNPDGSLATLIENGMSGAGAVDKYAPLNVPYQYAVTTASEEDSIKTVYVTNIIRSSRAFFYFDDDMASARWNQSYNVSYGRPEQEELRFSGRTLPVLVDDRARSIQGSANFTILDRSETAAFKRLMAHSGSVVYKSTDGDVMHAKVSVGFSRTIDTVSFYMQQLSINYTQVDGVVL